MIHAGISELRRAFHAHRNAATKTSGITYYLLLFYAAECGLKSIYLKENNLQKTDLIQDQAMLSQYGHNLNTWVKQVNTYPNKIEEAPHFHIEDGSNLDISKAHQAWRYGVRIKEEDEQKLVKWLENLCNWIKGNI
ncbi:MAG: hypothetical protein F6K35_18330 [Okeania sp. SIO2H7]|nr:hypothetical protein [Okeania sp. SIO2H7]